MGTQQQNNISASDLTQTEHSPVICILFEKNISLLNAIEIRNWLTGVIEEYQKPLLKDHNSNGGNKGDRI